MPLMKRSELNHQNSYSSLYKLIEEVLHVNNYYQFFNYYQYCRRFS